MKLLPQLNAALPPTVKVTVLTDRTITIRASVRDVELERRAREDASTQTRLPVDTFPATGPWDADRVLDPDFFPEP